jgi:hypothetical protein
VPTARGGQSLFRLVPRGEPEAAPEVVAVDVDESLAEAAALDAAAAKQVEFVPLTAPADVGKVVAMPARPRVDRPELKA